MTKMLLEYIENGESVNDLFLIYEEDLIYNLKFYQNEVENLKKIKKHVSIPFWLKSKKLLQFEQLLLFVR